MSPKTAPEAVFVANAVFPDFELDLGSILDENSMENLMIFPSRSRFFFPTWRSSRNIVNYMLKRTFHFFPFSIFVRKIDEKKRLKNCPAKKVEK